MLRVNGRGTIDTTLLLKYRNTLSRKTEYYLCTIRGFLYTWHELGYEGITDDVIELLESLVLK